MGVLNSTPYNSWHTTMSKRKRDEKLTKVHKSMKEQLRGSHIGKIT